MNELSEEQKRKILDFVGKLIIENVRDASLKIAMDIAKYETKNPGKLNQYESFSTFSEQQKEDVCDLLSETITDTIFNFLDLFEYKHNVIKFLVTFEGKEYDMCEVSEKMGGEISFMDDSGWIQKFSKIGRFVL
jgi:hypothetical protein